MARQRPSRLARPQTQGRRNWWRSWESPTAGCGSFLLDTYGPLDGARVPARVLGAISQQGAEVVGKALERALETGNSTPMGLIPLPVREVPGTMAAPSSPMGYRVETARAADYDALLVGGRHETARRVIKDLQDLLEPRLEGAD